jgi:hypothetical protein
MFWRKHKTIADPDLGNLEFSLNRWSARTVGEAACFIAIHGDRDGPNPIALAEAKRLLASQAELAAAAIGFARSDPEASAFSEGQGELIFEGITASPIPGSFTVELGLSGWPDAMVDVQFKSNNPTAVLLGD